MNREAGYFLPKSIREVDRRHARPNPAQYLPFPLEPNSSPPPRRPASALKFSSGLLTGVVLATAAVLLSDLMGIRVRLPSPSQETSTAAVTAVRPQVPAEVIDKYEQLKRQVEEADRRVLDADQRVVELNKALAEQTLKARNWPRKRWISCWRDCRRMPRTAATAAPPPACGNRRTNSLPQSWPGWRPAGRT
ncbi:hypothetical protein [Methylococcus capsulatus]|uniref:hypothetical protein n=1 Tax=Methylococcus capsulatus TaxID=414 RepID=UPI00117C046D|nr:hypothetical protein [Methylococcus capsulatus]